MSEPDEIEDEEPLFGEPDESEPEPSKEEKPKRKPMKPYKEPESDWKIQANLKTGQHLFNIRAKTWEEFDELAEGAMERRERLLVLCALFEPSEPVLPLAPSASSQPVQIPQPAEKGIEIGPVKVEKIEQAEGISQKGRAYTRSTVKFAGGVAASTFDTLVAEAAKQLLGKNCYARVEKTEKYGYNLLSLRTAA